MAVVAPRDKSAGITETVRRISVGGADNVPFFQVTNLSRTMKKLQSAGPPAGKSYGFPGTSKDSVEFLGIPVDS